MKEFTGVDALASAYATSKQIRDASESASLDDLKRMHADMVVLLQRVLALSEHAAANKSEPAVWPRSGRPKIDRRWWKRESDGQRQVLGLTSDIT